PVRRLSPRYCRCRTVLHRLHCLRAQSNSRMELIRADKQPTAATTFRQEMVRDPDSRWLLRVKVRGEGIAHEASILGASSLQHALVQIKFRGARASEIRTAQFRDCEVQLLHAFWR